jgi:L-alanine-DL-glutamate epimerase-like enolase superfamily enzyme
MADVNSGWSRSFAVQRGQALEPYELFWLEEPLPPFDLQGYTHLAESLVIPIAVGEHEIFNRWDALSFLVAKAVDVVQPDLRQGISEIKSAGQTQEENDYAGTGDGGSWLYRVVPDPETS